MNSPTDSTNCNVALRLKTQADRNPAQTAIAWPATRIRVGAYQPKQHREYKKISFQQLNQQVDAVAAGLQASGMLPGDRIVLLVHFGPDFIALVLALLKIGVTAILIDPGMPREHLVSSLADANPDGFVAITKVQLLLKFLKRRFPKATKNITVGPTLGFLPSPTYAQLKSFKAGSVRVPTMKPSDPAAIIFTTGSTGPPKGVLYTHEMFCAQVDRLTEHYGIQPGGLDLACFPLFGLFDAVMGTTTVIPDMNPIRPADVDPPRLLDAIDQWQINQAFGSPALWKAVGRYCDSEQRKCPSLKFVLSAGAPVPASTLMSIRQMMHPDGVMFTPYGATEALPIASIESRVILDETAVLTENGKGTCVGEHFTGIEWKVIAIDDGPIATFDLIEELPVGEIGELIVRGNVVSPRYMTRTDQNAFHKIESSEGIWHRMGDVGYIDEQNRFFYCGRKAHRVVMADGVTLFTEPCECILNWHPQVSRSALVGVVIDGQMEPVVVIEPTDQDLHKSNIGCEKLIQEMRRLAKSKVETNRIERFLIYPKKLPTDIRHNSKIFREKLQTWAQAELNIRT